MDTTSRGSSAVRVALVAAVLVCLAGAAALGAKAYTIATAAPVVSSVYNEEGIVPSAEAASVDFQALSSQNSDVCAWLSEPVTGINTAVVKSQAKEDFYKSHDAMGVSSDDGAVFFDQYNASDLSDAVTVLNVNEGSQVGEKLLSFGSSSVFDQAENLYVHMPGYVCTYRVVAAFRDDDQDTLAKYNYFASYDDLSAFEENLADPDAVSSNVSTDISFDASSKFLVLSTYQTGTLASGHYIVCGVLTDESAV